MIQLPDKWLLLEEWDNNFIFQTSDGSFSVQIDFTAQLEFPYSISFTQLKGTYVQIGFEHGAYATHASLKPEALSKAIEMMKFINTKFNC